MQVQGVQGQECPQHESAARTSDMLPHKTRVRHKKQAQVNSVGVEGCSRPSSEGGQHSANPGREVQSSQGCLGGVQGLQAGVQGGLGRFGAKNAGFQ